MANKTTGTNQSKRFLSVAEVAGELGVSSKHVRRMIARGDLRIYRFGKVIRIARDDLDRDVDRHRQ
ncbi:MAG: helix-turn-helix domain-containing protein [Aestuariivirga sp.]